MGSCTQVALLNPIILVLHICKHTCYACLYQQVVDEPTPHAANGTSNGSKAPAPSPSTTPSAAAHSTAAQGLRHFLDERQYATDNLLRYEVVYGRGFSSPGGAQSAAELSGLLQLQVRCRVDYRCLLAGTIMPSNTSRNVRLQC